MTFYILLVLEVAIISSALNYRMPRLLTGACALLRNVRKTIQDMVPRVLVSDRISWILDHFGRNMKELIISIY